MGLGGDAGELALITDDLEGLRAALAGAAFPAIVDRRIPGARRFYTSDPFGVYRWMRDEAPVYWSERYQWWALTRFEDVRAAAPNAVKTESGIVGQPVTFEVHVIGVL